MRNLGIVALGAALSGCASSAADIAPAYVSPVAYQSYTCQQLALEAQSISTRAATLSGAQDSQRTKDGVATAAAIVIFWPAAFFVGGDKQTAAELSQMKGRWLPLSRPRSPRSATFSFKESQRLPERRQPRTMSACPPLLSPIKISREALANKGHDTRALQTYLGHKNIQHTVRHTELAAGRFKDF